MVLCKQSMKWVLELSKKNIFLGCEVPKISMNYMPIFKSVLAESTIKIPVYCSLKQMTVLDD